MILILMPHLILKNLTSFATLTKLQRSVTIKSPHLPQNNLIQPLCVALIIFGLLLFTCTKSSPFEKFLSQEQNDKAKKAFEERWEKEKNAKNEEKGKNGKHQVK